MSRVLVTGGASGLGAALVARFVAGGHKVLCTDLAAEVAGHGATEYRQLNVRSADDWAAAVTWCDEHWGGLDILVNNAGIATGGRIDVESLDEWDRVLDINLMGVVRGCRAFAPVFKKQRSGHIVNTASAAGLVHPPMMSSYNTVKAGVVALSETLSHELHPYGVTVSVVCPSFFRTNLADSIQGADDEMGSVARRLIEKSPRTADDIAAGVLAGIEKHQFLIIPDRPALLAWRTKRFARPLYDRKMRKIATRARDRADLTTHATPDQTEPDTEPSGTTVPDHGRSRSDQPAGVGSRPDQRAEAAGRRPGQPAAAGIGLRPAQTEADGAEPTGPTTRPGEAGSTPVER